MKNLFKVNQEKIVETAVVGIEQESGFSGLQIIMEKGQQSELYFANGEIIKSRPAGMMDEVDMDEVSRELDAVRKDLMEEIRLVKSRSTFTKYDQGFKSATIYFDGDDITPHVEEAQPSFKDGSMYVSALKSAQEASNNFFYDGGDSLA